MVLTTIYYATPVAYYMLCFTGKIIIHCWLTTKPKSRRSENHTALDADRKSAIFENIAKITSIYIQNIHYMLYIDGEPFFH